MRVFIYHAAIQAPPPPPPPAPALNRIATEKNLFNGIPRSSQQSQSLGFAPVATAKTLETDTNIGIIMLSTKRNVAATGHAALVEVHVTARARLINVYRASLSDQQ